MEALMEARIVHLLTKDEESVIARLALANSGYDPATKEEAVRVYYEALRRGVGPREGPYMSFMSEVDNKVPDLILRALYRTKIVQAQGEAA